MLAVWLALAAPLGCYKTTIVTGKAPSGETHTKRSRFLLWGLVGSPSYELQKMCPTGVARIEEEMDPLAAGMTVCTAGLITPRKVTVTCASGVTWNLSSDEQGLVLAEVSP